MKHLKNPCFIYTILWCLYWCQGIVYQSDSIISQSVAMLILCMSLFFTSKYIACNRISGYPKALMSVLTMVTVFGVIAYFTDGTVIKGKMADTMLFAWFRNMYLSILPIFTYLYFVQKKYLDVKFVKMMLPVIILATLCSYYWSYLTAIQMAFLKTGTDVTETTNNAGYTVLSLIPALLVYDNKRLWQYLGLLLIVCLVALSVKRGAVMVCAMMSFLFMLRSFSHSSGRKKFLTIFLLIIVSILVYDFVMDYMAESDYLMKRIEETKEGRASGRDDIYTTLWNSFKNQTDTWKYFFGGGVWYTTKLTWTAAHNDWLEFLIDMGLFGVIVYIYYWVSFFRLSIKKHLPELSRFCVFLIFLNMFMRTLFSMSLDSMTFVQGMMIALSYYGLLNSYNVK